eukprot:scaffold5966_cov118-Cylindrotheca_fusiformis.AAC.4
MLVKPRIGTWTMRIVAVVAFPMTTMMNMMDCHRSKRLKDASVNPPVEETATYDGFVASHLTRTDTRGSSDDSSEEEKWEDPGVSVT